MHSICRSLYKIYNRNTIACNSKSLKFGRTENITPGFLKHFCSFQNSNDIVAELSQGDEEVAYRLKVLLMEMELLRQEGEMVPETHQMKPKYFKELLEIKHRNARRRYLEYLFKLGKTKENEDRKKQERALRYEEYKSTVQHKDLSFEEFVQTYDLSHNSILLRIRDRSINKLYNKKLINAMQFGQKLIFDCGYHSKMTARENSNCAKQLMLLFAANRLHDDPYDLHLCNYDESSRLGQSLHTLVPTLYDTEFPMNIHQGSYLDLFPKDQLVYLTPHCREEMKEYDHDAFYIIGAIVDKSDQSPLSLAKAKQQNIRMMKFPLDRYLAWSSGSNKSLTLDAVVKILLDLKNTGDWSYALRHVPQRKVVRDEDLLQEVRDKLMKSKKRWTPKVDLDNLSFNKYKKYGSFNNRNSTGYKKKDDNVQKHSQSISSLFRNN